MTEKQFLQAICHDAADDLTRLIFSDWLEEHGQVERAEFIRLQVARAADENGDAGRPELLERERELLARHQESWLTELPRLSGITWGESSPRPHVEPHHFQRGFLFRAEVKDAASFRQHARTICEQTTVRSLSLQLSDRPSLSSPAWPQELLGFVQSPQIASFSHLHIVPKINLRIGAEGIRLLAASPYLAGLRSLNVNQQGVGDEGTQLLANADRFAGLTELILAGNGLTSQGLFSLARSVHVTQLRRLNLSYTPREQPFMIPFDAEGLTLLGANNFRQLQALALDNTNLDDAAVTGLTRGTLPRLRSLSIGFNKISAIGMQTLARSQLFAELRELRIGHNPLETAGAVALIKTAPLDHLHTLDLSGSRLGTEAVYLLGGSAVGQRLGQLDLAGNPIGVEGLRFFLDRRFWPNLSQLSLSYQPHERDVAESLKECWGDRLDLLLDSSAKAPSSKRERRRG